MMLSESLKAVATQTLCKKVGEDAGGPRGAPSQQRGLQPHSRGKDVSARLDHEIGRVQGMQRLNDALLDLVRRKMILPE